MYRGIESHVCFALPLSEVFSILMIALSLIISADYPVDFNGNYFTYLIFPLWDLFNLSRVISISLPVR